jgi:hypothetical protein
MSRNDCDTPCGNEDKHGLPIFTEKSMKLISGKDWSMSLEAVKNDRLNLEPDKYQIPPDRIIQ